MSLFSGMSFWLTTVSFFGKSDYPLLYPCFVTDVLQDILYNIPYNIPMQYTIGYPILQTGYHVQYPYIIFNQGYPT